MQLLFLWENLHFGIHLLLGLAFLACFWLYIDASVAQKRWRLWLNLVAWLVLAASFFMNAMTIESTLFVSSLSFIRKGALFVRLSGYILLAISVLTDRLQDRPGTKGLSLVFPTLTVPKVVAFMPALLPPAALLVSFAYWRRATVGLERHVKPVARAFLVLTLYEIVTLGRLLRSTTNPTLFRFVAPFGPLWMIEMLFVALTAAILIWWVGQYLLRRLQTQLFMIFVSMSVGIFLLTTITFSTYLLNFTEATSLERLRSDARTVEYMMQSSKQALISDAQVVAHHTLVQQIIQDPARANELNALARTILLQKKETMLVITDAEGKILARGESSEGIGDSLSDTPLVSQARQGQSVASVVSSEGALAPVLSLRAAVPITVNNAVVGTVLLGTTLDNVYVDGLKQATGLDIAFYAQNTLSASTITSYDATTRWVGTENTNQTFTNPVLKEGKTVSGPVRLLSTGYLAAYLPLKNIDEHVIGMFLVSIPEVSLLAEASQSLQLTFMTSIVFMLFSFLPSFYFARKLSRQIQ